MSSNPHLSVIVPAYNEAKSIARTVTAISNYLNACGETYEIIVSADGDDGTRGIVAEMVQQDGRISVIGSAERGGKGRGIRNGVAIARGQIIGFCDADYKTPIEEIEKLLPAFQDGFDVVIASRGMKETVILNPQPMYRRIGSRAFGIGMHLVIGLWGIHDTQCGFKFFRGAVAKELFGQSRIDGYMFDVEILHLAEKRGYKIKEVGVRWQDDGDSRLDLVSGNWKNFKDILRIRFGGHTTSNSADTAAATTQR